MTALRLCQSKRSLDTTGDTLQTQPVQFLAGTTTTTMTVRWLFPLLMYAAIVIAPAHLNAVEITGNIRSVNGGAAVITVDGDTVPSVGDKADIFFELATTNFHAPRRETACPKSREDYQKMEQILCHTAK